MFMVGAILAVTVVFAALIIVFNSFNFMSRRVNEEDLLGATVNYIEILEGRMKRFIAAGDFRASDFISERACGINCQEMSCQRIEQVLQGRGKTLGMDCIDPLGRSWVLRKVNDSFYIHFDDIPDNTIRKLGYENTPEMQKHVALKLAARVTNSGYVADQPDLVYLPGISDPVRINTILNNF